MNQTHDLDCKPSQVDAAADNTPRVTMPKTVVKGTQLDELRWPSSPSPNQSPETEVWQYSDTPSAVTEAEEAWAAKYPASVGDMAKRKLYRRKAVFQVPVKSRKHSQKEDD